MEQVNMHEAKTHLSRLVEKAAKGEPFIIAKAGKPMVKVIPIEEKPKRAVQRIGFMEGQFEVPDDFDTMFQKEIEEMFYGNPDKFKDVLDEAAAGYSPALVDVGRLQDAERTGA